MTQEKKTYLVGGAVRDQLLRRPVHDRDFVRVGYTHEDMLAEGFTPVGDTFPVYLHPVTREEYALARTEVRTGEGHTGFATFFSPEVTLEEDLSRRDLTINAMAQDIETGEIIDPYNGQLDIASRRLRHTTSAFMDDPLRILRLYRFLAQLGSHWRVDPYTAKLCADNSFRLAEITPERKWKEMEKALNSRNFMEYAEMMGLFGELEELTNLRGVLQPKEHHPEGDAYVHTLLCLRRADQFDMSPKVKLAVLCHDFGKAATFAEFGNLIGHEEAGVPIVKNFCERMRVPNEFRDVALMVTENHTRVHCILGRDGQSNAQPKTIMKLLERSGILKNPHRANMLANACSIDQAGRGFKNASSMPYPQADILLASVRAVRELDVKPISRKMVEEGKQGVWIGEAIRVARIGAIRKVMREYKEMVCGKES